MILKTLLVVLFGVNTVLATEGNVTEIPEVVTSLGTIRGSVISSPLDGDIEVEQFVGIPFALPPVGERRFQNPEPYGEFPGGSIDAFEFSPSCIQTDPPSPPDIPEMSEDCLYLNVWRPRPVTEARPVMVWIYGGGFNSGSAMIPSYNGSVLAARGDLIYVAMNYRINMFGFFHTGDDRMANGNFGLLDQQMALRWVRDHVASFGGDPSRITIFGESAGGASVAHQLLVPGNQGLFTRAILQSGDSVADWAWDRLDRRVEIATQSIADNANCTNDATLLDCLRAIDGETLLEVYGRSTLVSGAPKVDGVTLTDEPEILLQTGQFVPVDVIIGYVQDEGSLFIFFIPGVTPDILFGPEPFQALINAARSLGSVKSQTEAEIQAIIEEYAPADNSSESVRDAISDMYGDNRFLCPGEFTAGMLNDYGVTVYEYLITVRSTLADNFYPDWMGVPHGDDIQWVLGWPWFLQEDAGHTWTESEKRFSLEVMDLWARFARVGDPGAAAQGDTGGDVLTGAGDVKVTARREEGAARTVKNADKENCKFAQLSKYTANRINANTKGANIKASNGVSKITGVNGVTRVKSNAAQSTLWTPWTAQGPAYLEIGGEGEFTMFNNTSARPGKCQLWRF